MKFCINCQKKILSVEIFYTTAGSGGSDYYQVCALTFQRYDHWRWSLLWKRLKSNWEISHSNIFPLTFQHIESHHHHHRCYHRRRYHRRHRRCHPLLIIVFVIIVVIALISLSLL